MAKRKKRVAKLVRVRPAKSVGQRNVAPPQNGGRLRSVALLQNGGQLVTAGQPPNVARLQSGDRLLGVQVQLNVNRPGKVARHIPQSHHRKRRRKRCRADHHHRKIRLQLTKNRNAHSGMLPVDFGC